MHEHQPPETVSVIIPTKNEEEMLESCLISVYSQSLNPEEVIIVDGGLGSASPRKTPATPLRYIRQGTPVKASGNAKGEEQIAGTRGQRSAVRGREEAKGKGLGAKASFGTS